MDLGCGPGLTTRLVADVLGGRETVGLDVSERFIAAARVAEPDLEFVVHDVTQTPFPGAPPDFLYARFLLTHLADPGSVLQAWSGAIRPGGLVVLEELHAMTGSVPVLQRYYEIVAAMQAAHGQTMQVGRALPGLARAAGLTALVDRVAEWRMPGAPMAQLHHLNIATWRQDEWVRANVDPAEIDAVEAGLGELASKPDPSVYVDYWMTQLVLRR
jgi:SAM-dependent methyltransferase